ncbi:MAG: P-loop NTPase [Candidatus Aenigmarchaeota archaeon]|nr:P-loop NTPase [Candidatus Aenigmarchaeota archaeon]
MTRVIGISSGKGGVGKTTVAANLGLALRALGKRVLIVDCNLSTPHLGYYLGITDYKRTLNDVLLDRVAADAAVYNHDGLRVMPASLDMADLIGLDLKKFRKTVVKLADPTKFDFVLLDSAPGLGREAVCVLNAADEILFVTNPFVPMLNDVLRSIGIIKQLGHKKVGVVLNMVTGQGHELFEHTVESVLAVPVVGSIPFDSGMAKSLASGVPIIESAPSASASIGFMRLAASLAGVEYTPPSALSALASRIKSRLLELSRVSDIRVPQSREYVEREMFIQEGQRHGDEDESG